MLCTRGCSNAVQCCATGSHALLTVWAPLFPAEGLLFSTSKSECWCPRRLSAVKHLPTQRQTSALLGCSRSPCGYCCWSADCSCPHTAHWAEPCTQLAPDLAVAEQAALVQCIVQLGAPGLKVGVYVLVVVPNTHWGDWSPSPLLEGLVHSFAHLTKVLILLVAQAKHAKGHPLHQQQKVVVTRDSLEFMIINVLSTQQQSLS